MRKRAAAVLLLLAISACAPALHAPKSTAPAAAERYRLSWAGKARVFAGERTIDIGVRTSVVPSVRARSESWPLSEGPAAMRVMIIEPGGGWLARRGAREPMPEPMLRHERQQFAIYGLLLKAMQMRVPADRRATISHAGAPNTEFVWDDEGRIVEARNRVVEPDGAGEVDQVFLFSGKIAGDGVEWPRRIELRQRGRPYFILELESFDAQLE